MRRIITLGMLLLVAACNLEEYDTTPTEAPAVDVPAPLVAHVMTLAKAEQSSVLSALVVLVQAGMIGEYQWTAPTTGTAVEHYQTHTTADVPGESLYLLMVNKTNVTVEVRGVDAEDRIGPWSAMSDTAQAGKK